MADAWRPSATLAALRRRADLVERTRAFFRARGVLEVDTPVLQGGANLDAGVCPMRVEVDGGRFLPTSPEHPLKRLVASGSGPVWTLAPAFRAGERGSRHMPEFRMLEWYRPGWDDRQLAAEAIALIAELTTRGADHATLSYRDACRRHAGVDPLACADSDIFAALGADGDAARGDAHAALDLLFATRVEPRLGRGGWTVITDYPPWACAQARLRRDAHGDLVAARFEIYGDGLELANGYWELDDAPDLRTRLEAEWHARPERASLRLDERFLAAMAHGLGDCAGIAVGFDRVVMLALGIEDIARVQAFAWDRA
ncbi:MAG TPA: EF-P lysine aminoacylase EpmA [Planctomycetota bacterium]|nr:EF-P lysine aminoacylase EpmA [Planctomycetota bacterium]